MFHTEEVYTEKLYELLVTTEYNDEHTGNEGNASGTSAVFARIHRPRHEVLGSLGRYRKFANSCRSSD